MVVFFQWTSFRIFWVYGDDVSNFSSCCNFGFKLQVKQCGKCHRNDMASAKTHVFNSSQHLTCQSIHESKHEQIRNHQHHVHCQKKENKNSAWVPSLKPWGSHSHIWLRIWGSPFKWVIWNRHQEVCNPASQIFLEQKQQYSSRPKACNFTISITTGSTPLATSSAFPRSSSAFGHALLNLPCPFWEKQFSSGDLRTVFRFHNFITDFRVKSTFDRCLLS